MTESQAPGLPRSPAIPFRIRVGVTGHRALEHQTELAGRVEAALQRVCRLVPASAVTPVLLSVVASLAEGADRLVVAAVLAHPESLFEAILPLAPEDFRADFATEESRRDFDDLLARAATVAIVEPLPSRQEAYERAGYDMVERCDILIALWDGLPGRGVGGTAEVVAFARRQHKPLIWIETAPPFHVHEERLGGDLAAQFRHLDAYNRDGVDAGDLAGTMEEQTALLAAAAGRIGLPRETLQPYCDWLVPHFARADALARRYQRRFLTFGTLIFVLAAAATVTVSVQAQFFPTHPLIALAEVGFIAVNWLIVYAARDRGRVQQRWMTYRALSERLRARLFLAMVEDGGQSSPGDARPHAMGWVERACDELWRARPTAPAQTPVEQLRQVLVQTWLQPQLTFMRSRRHTHERRNHRIVQAVNLGWGTAVVVVVLHAFGIGSARTGASSLLIVLAVALPAFIAALQAIGEQREYERNAVRYEQIEPALAALARRMERVSTRAGLAGLALQAEALLLAENRDWVFTVQFRDLTISKT